MLKISKTIKFISIFCSLALTISLFSISALALMTKDEYKDYLVSIGKSMEANSNLDALYEDYKKSQPTTGTTTAGNTQGTQNTGNSQQAAPPLNGFESSSATRPNDYAGLNGYLTIVQSSKAGSVGIINDLFGLASVTSSIKSESYDQPPVILDNSRPLESLKDMSETLGLTEANIIWPPVLLPENTIKWDEVYSITSNYSEKVTAPGAILPPLEKVRDAIVAINGQLFEDKIGPYDGMYSPDITIGNAPQTAIPSQLATVGEILGGRVPEPVYVTGREFGASVEWDEKTSSIAFKDPYSDALPELIK